MLRQADDQYRKIIFNAQMYANSGAGTYQKAVDMATKDFLSRGITCIEYKNGARHTMADYASMCLRKASKRAYLTGEGEKRQEWGEHLVILNKRGNACPLCLPFVGKVLIDDVWSGGSAADGNYPLMSAAIEAGLYHPNCKDGHTTYFPELEEIDTEYSKKEIEQLTGDYKQEQQQKYAERQADKFGRLAKYSLNPENKRIYEKRTNEWKIKKEKLVKNSQSDIIKPTKVISGHKPAPIRSDANDVINHLGDNGKVETRSFYDGEGKKVKDITNHDHNNPKSHPYGNHGEHAHEYTWQDEKIIDRNTRNLTDQERKENRDIL